MGRFPSERSVAAEHQKQVPHRAFGPVRNDKGCWWGGFFAAPEALLYPENDPAARLKPRPFKSSDFTRRLNAALSRLCLRRWRSLQFDVKCKVKSSGRGRPLHTRHIRLCPADSREPALSLGGSPHMCPGG